MHGAVGKTSPTWKVNTVDINIARTFLEVVKTGSFAGAADSLNLTQTAVSARIRVLEEQLDRPVFIRNKTGARMTPAGERFFRYASTLVQVWNRAKQSVALPPGRDTIAVVGAELSLWSPLLSRWLLWVRRECPDVAVRAIVNSPENLMEQIQDGALDVAILYDPPRRPGIIAELLFEEKLVLVKAASVDRTVEPEGHTLVDWGEDFLSSFHAAFPDETNPAVSISHGPLALEYILATGGSGYFRKGFIKSYLESGHLLLVPDRPEFSYSAYAVHSIKTDQSTVNRILGGLRSVATIQA